MTELDLKALREKAENLLARVEVLERRLGTAEWERDRLREALRRALGLLDAIAEEVSTGPLAATVKAAIKVLGIRAALAPQSPEEGK